MIIIINIERNDNMDALGMKGKTAVVTGAAQGIGEATALALAEQGVNVAAIDTNEDLLLGLTDRLRKKSAGAGVAQMYLTVRLSMISSPPLNATWGPIEILANVAGVLRPGPVQSLSDEDWDQTFSVNTTGVFHVSRAVSRYMIERQKAPSLRSVRMQPASACFHGGLCGVKSGCRHVYEMPRTGACGPSYPLQHRISGFNGTDMQRALWQDENGAGTSSEVRLIHGKNEIPLQKLAKPSDIG